MRAMILAAGQGKRLRPITDTIPKPLISIHGEPVIVSLIKQLKRVGIKEVVINISHCASEFEKILGRGETLGVEIYYSFEKEALETGGGIFQALTMLGSEPFLLISGDIVTDFPFKNLNDHLLDDKLAHLVLVDIPAYLSEGDFDLNQDKVFISNHPQYTYANIGLISPKIFDGCLPGRYPLAPLLIKAVENHKVTGEYYNGRWFNIGTPEELITLDDQYREVFDYGTKYSMKQSEEKL